MNRIRMKFSKVEKRDLFFAGVIISLAFAILLNGGYRAVLSWENSLIIAFFIAFFTAGVGFLLHELAHKIVAQRYGYFAEFRAYYQGLWIALVFSLFGFIFAAPGAVMIGGRMITRERNGKISLAGPLTNFVLALIFLTGIFVFGNGGFFGAFFSYGLTINSLLAAFNMIPVMPFDGAKIFAWNKTIYIVSVILFVALFFVSWIV